MVYSPFTEAETDSLSPHRQALWKKVKDNDADHKTRLDGLVGLKASALIDHFEHMDPAINFSVMAPHSSRWTTGVSGGTATVTIQSGVHIVILKTTFTDRTARLRGNYRVQPTLLPFIKMKCRVGDWSRIEDAVWGFQTDRALTSVLGDDAVLLWRRESPAHLKFVVRKDGSQTLDTTDIGLPANGEWFTIEIKYIDTDSVECRFNDSLIRTFNGPGDFVPSEAGDDMFPEIHTLHAAISGDLNVSGDWIEARNTSIADEA